MGIVHAVIAKSSLFIMAILPGISFAQEAGLFDPETGFRISSYRAPVPDHVPGAEVITIDRLRELRHAGALLIDTFPVKSYEINDIGQIIAPVTRQTIPTSVWLPIIGQGKIDAHAALYLRHALAELTAGNLHKEIVVFCLSDCWVSWNAAQRITALGYDRVHWYPDGVDGWEMAGEPLQSVSPFSIPLPVSGDFRSEP